MTFSAAADETKAIPRPVYAKVSCDVCGGEEIVLPCDWFPDCHADLMRKGWKYTPGGRAVWTGPECSGKPAAPGAGSNHPPPDTKQGDLFE